MIELVDVGAEVKAPQYTDPSAERAAVTVTFVFDGEISNSASLEEIDKA